MPFYQKGDVRIRYEEVGSGFPLLVTPGRRAEFAGQQLADRRRSTRWRNSRTISAVSRWTSATPMAASSTGPVPTEKAWDAFADDQLGLMDHLGIREFFYMGYCIGGCFAGKLLQRAPDRVVAAVFHQTVGYRPEDPDVMYRHSHDNWLPDFKKRRPEVSDEDDREILPQPVAGAARFPVQRVARVHQELPDADPGLAGRHAVASAADLDRCRLAGAERRDHGLPVARAGGTAAAHDQQGAQFPEIAPPDAGRGAIARDNKFRQSKVAQSRRKPGPTFPLPRCREMDPGFRRDSCPKMGKPIGQTSSVWTLCRRGRFRLALRRASPRAPAPA